jgi:acyl dehydratase
MTIFERPADLLDAVGTDLGVTDWLTIEQQRIDLFADATDDHQWIHVDPERAAAGPFGAPIAHGYLTLALTNRFLPELLEVHNVSMGVNYGVDKVRFPAPVTVGSRIRGAATITAASEIPGGVQVVVTITVEVDGGTKPACVVESISRFLD